VGAKKTRRVVMKKLILAVAFFLLDSSYCYGAQRRLPEQLMLITDESAWSIISGAVYYKIHGPSECEIGSFGGRTFTPSYRCSEFGGCISHREQDNRELLIFTLHNKDWKMLAYGEVCRFEGIADEIFIKKYFLDPLASPIAVKAIILNGMCNRRIFLYDSKGFLVWNEHYNGTDEFTADDRDPFESCVDLNSLQIIEHIRASCCDLVTQCLRKLIRRN
jgi:hypothetical protein